MSGHRLSDFGKFQRRVPKMAEKRKYQIKVDEQIILVTEIIKMAEAATIFPTSTTIQRAAIPRQGTSGR